MNAVWNLPSRDNAGLTYAVTPYARNGLSKRKYTTRTTLKPKSKEHAYCGNTMKSPNFMFFLYPKTKLS